MSSSRLDSLPPDVVHRIARTLPYRDHASLALSSPGVSASLGSSTLARKHGLGWKDRASERASGDSISGADIERVLDIIETRATGPPPPGFRVGPPGQNPVSRTMFRGNVLVRVSDDQHGGMWDVFIENNKYIVGEGLSIGSRYDGLPRLLVPGDHNANAVDLTKKVALPIAMRLIRAMRRRPWYTRIRTPSYYTDVLHRLGLRIDTVGPTSYIGPRQVETAATVAAERRRHEANKVAKTITSQAFQKALNAAARERRPGA